MFMAHTLTLTFAHSHFNFDKLRNCRRITLKLHTYYNFKLVGEMKKRQHYTAGMLLRLSFFVAENFSASADLKNSTQQP